MKNKQFNQALSIQGTYCVTRQIGAGSNFRGHQMQRFSTVYRVNLLSYPLFCYTEQKWYHLMSQFLSQKSINFLLWVYISTNELYSLIQLLRFRPGNWNFNHPKFYDIKIVPNTSSLLTGSTAQRLSVDSVARLPGFKSHLIHLKLCDLGQVTALCLSFPNSKLKIIVVAPLCYENYLNIQMASWTSSVAQVLAVISLSLIKPHIGSVDLPGSEPETRQPRNDTAGSGQAQESLPVISTNVPNGKNYFFKFQFSPWLQGWLWDPCSFSLL